MHRVSFGIKGHLFLILANDFLNEFINLVNIDLLDYFDPESFSEESRVHCEQLCESLNRRLTEFLLGFVCEHDEFLEHVLPENFVL